MKDLRLLSLCILHAAVAVPLALQDLMLADDSVSVGTFVRPVRSTAPEEDYHKSYEHEGDGEIGYSRKKSGGGKKGYQHFDSYHKKAGDNYEFEKQDSFGHEEEEQAGAHSHPKERKAKPHREFEREDTDEQEEKPRRKENDHEEIREGDENKGEVSGYDPADYTLPEKYTYGAGEEYNFK
ncbi:ABC transporter F family member 4-like [Leptidea sinapis]|uniref:Uncharacterized protein n=1 Tax=Leptidea sinapis TaxID=189913 RepID=A0A5E4Q0X3_9NEOP|nr:ABC transporter F family member 4-like [Leptidea sinapis]XP_050681750.1 ABC transporter F family member 4-like [Leptidea sinapis]VVC91109.1 unnamed protein product [Leptidea sinapis]